MVRFDVVVVKKTVTAAARENKPLLLSLQRIYGIKLYYVMRKKSSKLYKSGLLWESHSNRQRTRITTTRTTAQYSVYLYIA